MMGERRTGQGTLSYEFSLDPHVPAEHGDAAPGRGE